MSKADPIQPDSVFGNFWSYENQLLAILSVSEGCLLLDRVAVGLLSPLISAELSLSNADLGILSAVFTLAFALSGYCFSAISDSLNSRDKFLLGSLAIFSVVSSLTGLVTSLVTLTIFRILLGVTEGPFLPIAQARMSTSSSPERVTFNLAFLQQVGAFILAQGIGPILLTHLGQVYGWRTAFYFSGAPGLLVFILLFMLTRRKLPNSAVVSYPRTAAPSGKPAKFRDLLRYRNVVLAGCIASSMGTWVLLQVTFLPQYLVRVAGLTPSRMGFVMSMTGVSGCISSVLMPMLSGKWGRRPTMIAGTAAGLILPLSVMFLPHQPILLMGGVLLGSISFACSPLHISILPNDVVPRNLVARAIAFTSACSAIVGGTVMPPIGGHLADRFGLTAPLWMAAGGALLACGFAMCLQESAPHVLIRRRPAMTADDR